MQAGTWRRSDFVGRGTGVGAVWGTAIGATLGILLGIALVPAGAGGAILLTVPIGTGVGAFVGTGSGLASGLLLMLADRRQGPLTYREVRAIAAFGTPAACLAGSAAWLALTPAARTDSTPGALATLSLLFCAFGMPAGAALGPRVVSGRRGRARPAGFGAGPGGRPGDGYDPSVPVEGLPPAAWPPATRTGERRTVRRLVTTLLVLAVPITLVLIYVSTDTSDRRPAPRPQYRIINQGPCYSGSTNCD